MPNKDMQHLNKENSLKKGKYKEAEDVAGKLDIKSMLLNDAEPFNVNGQDTLNDQNADKQWVSDSLERMEEEDEKRRKEKALKAQKEKEQKERSKQLRDQDENQRLDLYAEDLIDLKNSQIGVSIPKNTVLQISHGKQFLERLTAAKRAQKQKNKKSRLYNKLRNAEELEKQLSDVYDSQYATRLEMAKEVKCNISASDFNDICNFMTSTDKSKNIDLLKLFMAGRDDNGNPQVDEYHAKLALVEAANQILGIKLDGIRLDSDKDIVENTVKLEKYSMLVASFDRLTSKYKFFENLGNEKKQSIKSKLSLLRPVLTYYTLRKEIIGNKEYKNHYDDELSMDYSKATTKEQKELAGLLMSSYVVGKNMMSLTGKKSSGMKALRFRDNSATQAYAKIVEDFAPENEKVYREKLQDNYSPTDSLADIALKLHSEGLNVDVQNDESMVDEEQIIAHNKKMNESEYLSKPLSTMLSSDELIPLKSTREMAALKKSIGALSAFSSNSFPPVKLDEEGKLDEKNEKLVKDEIDAVCTSMLMLYNRVTDSINNFIKKYGSGYTELTEMLTELSKQVSSDSETFRQKTIEYREIAANDPELCKKPITILDTIRYNRGVFYDLDNDNTLTVSIEGAAASTVYKITRNVAKTKDNPEGKEVVYFRKKDNVPPENNQELVDDVLSRYEISEEVKSKLREGFNSILGNEEIGKMFFLRLKSIKNTPKEYFADAAVVATGAFIAATGIDIAIPQQEKKEAWRLFVDFTNAVTKRKMATMKGSPYIDCGKNLSDRNVATSRLATLLGISSIVCESRTATIRMNGKLVTGNLMENSGGVSTTSKKNPATYSDTAIEQIFQMQVFDFICGQTDRHFGNFHGILENGQFTQIKCIDNDMSFGKLKAKDIDGYFYNRSIPISDNGISGLSAEFINKIMALDKPYLEQVLGDILDEKEIAALMDRLNCVKAHVLNTARNNNEIKWDKKKKKISFTGSIKDDKLRRLKAIKAYQKYINQNKKQKLELEHISKFYGPHIKLTNIDKMISDRKAELKNAANK